MVKGINKQMIVLKIEGNRLYDSACFVLKNEVTRSKESEKDMLYEANRLLGEMELKRSKKKGRGVGRRLLVGVLLLLLGAVGGFALSFFI